MKPFVRLFYRIVTRLDDRQLAERWTWNFFLTRSRIRAYWLTLIN